MKANVGAKVFVDVDGSFLEATLREEGGDLCELFYPLLNDCGEVQAPKNDTGCNDEMGNTGPCLPKHPTPSTRLCSKTVAEPPVLNVPGGCSATSLSSPNSVMSFEQVTAMAVKRLMGFASKRPRESVDMAPVPSDQVLAEVLTPCQVFSEEEKSGEEDGAGWPPKVMTAAIRPAPRERRSKVRRGEKPNVLPPPPPAE